MTDERFHSVPPTAPGPFPGAGAVVRVLAVVDAVALQVLLLCWAWSWPKHGSALGAVFSAVMVWWAFKRVRRALFDYQNFRWFTWRLAKLMLFGALIRGAMLLAG